MEKKYNTLKCGCKYSVDNNEDVIYCGEHTTWEEVKPMIARDVRRILYKMAFGVELPV